MFLELLKKYFWIAKLVFVALLASELAMLTNTRIDAKLGSVEAVKLDNVKVEKTQPYVALSDYNPILKKNIFNSDYVYVDDALTGGMKKAPEDYQLMGTIAWNQPWSMAVIQSRTSGKTGVYRTGQKVSDDTEVTLIERKMVTVTRAGKQEILRLPEIEVQANRVKIARTDGNVNEGDIKKVGDTDYVVSKDMLDAGFQNPMMWMRGARVVPHFEKGGISGFQLSNIKPDSLYGKIGLQDGDVIRRINNIEIKGPEEAFRLMSEIKNAKNVSMDITRNGKRMSYSYTVR